MFGSMGESTSVRIKGLPGLMLSTEGRQPADSKMGKLLALQKILKLRNQRAGKSHESVNQVKHDAGGSEAASVRRGNEDDALHGRHGLEKHRLAQKLPGFRRHLHFIKRPLWRVLPEAVAAADRRDFGEQSALL
jgi:hypothetical protein